MNLPSIAVNALDAVSRISVTAEHGINGKANENEIPEIPEDEIPEIPEDEIPEIPSGNNDN